MNNPNNSSEKSQLQLAEQYLSAGISIIPIRTDGSKRPAINSWTPEQKTIPCLDQVQDWIASGPCGLAAVCGKVSGSLELLDFDDFALFEPWKAIVDDILPGLVDRLTQNRTPAPGMHVPYRCSVIAGNTKLARKPVTDPGTGKIIPEVMIETRGEGGYFLVPGCPPTCHETGGLYEHVCGPPLTHVAVIRPEEREVLWRAARSFDRWVEQSDVHDGPRSTANNNGSLRPGDDYNRRGPSWALILEPHGWVEVRDGHWRRPGKEGRVWSATTTCKSQKDGNELFCCFSSNAHPFEGARGDGKSCTAYSRFAVFTLLNHGGDFSAAAKALAEEGYGEPKGHPGSAKAAPGGETQADKPQTMYSIILDHFRGFYDPSFRRGTAIYSGKLGREILPGEACFAPGINLIDKLAQASDAPRYKDNITVNRSAIPAWFKQWARSAWVDLIQPLAEEPETDEVVATAAEQFESHLRTGLLTMVSLGRTYQNDGKQDIQKVETRSLVRWSQVLAREGVWSDIRSYSLWTRTDQGRLRIALRVELFSQAHASKLFGDLTQNKFGRLCELYGLGQAKRVLGQRVVELTAKLVNSLAPDPRSAEEEKDEDEQ
jgi:putative DNA primase/helicase